MIETHDSLNTTPQPDEDAESISLARTLRDLDRSPASQALIDMRAGLLMPMYLDDRVGQADIDADIDNDR
jgi:hypothetical protein